MLMAETPIAGMALNAWSSELHSVITSTQMIDILEARDYGIVEIGHQFVLHNIADRLRLENELNNVKR